MPNNDLVLRPGESRTVYVTVIGVIFFCYNCLTYKSLMFLTLFLFFIFKHQNPNRVTWSRDSDDFLPQGVTQIDDNLVIQNARPDISGNYVCTVLTPQGEIRQVLIINVPGKKSRTQTVKFLFKKYKIPCRASI